MKVEEIRNVEHLMEYAHQQGLGSTDMVAVAILELASATRQVARSMENSGSEISGSLRDMTAVLRARR